MRNKILTHKYYKIYDIPESTHDTTAVAFATKLVEYP